MRQFPQSAQLDEQLDEGLLDEARSLYPLRALNALQTVGYRELFDFIDSRHDLEEAVHEIVHFYSVFHSYRYVGDKIALRITREEG